MHKMLHSTGCKGLRHGGRGPDIEGERQGLASTNSYRPQETDTDRRIPQQTITDTTPGAV